MKFETFLIFKWINLAPGGPHFPRLGLKFSGKILFLTKKHILNSYIETENRSFPKRKIDLKCQKLDGLDLPENHPGEADEKYKERRNKTKALVQNCGMKIPKIDYHQDKIKIRIKILQISSWH